MANQKTYFELIQELDAASVALRYCANPQERPALVLAKRAAESALEAYIDAESDQDLACGD